MVPSKNRAAGPVLISIQNHSVVNARRTCHRRRPLAGTVFAIALFPGTTGTRNGSSKITTGHCKRSESRASCNRLVQSLPEQLKLLTQTSRRTLTTRFRTLSPLSRIRSINVSKYWSVRSGRDRTKRPTKSIAASRTLICLSRNLPATARFTIGVPSIVQSTSTITASALSAFARTCCQNENKARVRTAHLFLESMAALDAGSCTCIPIYGNSILVAKSQGGGPGWLDL